MRFLSVILCTTVAMSTYGDTNDVLTMFEKMIVDRLEDKLLNDTLGDDAGQKRKIRSQKIHQKSSRRAARQTRIGTSDFLSRNDLFSNASPKLVLISPTCERKAWISHDNVITIPGGADSFDKTLDDYDNVQQARFISDNVLVFTCATEKGVELIAYNLSEESITNITPDESTGNIQIICGNENQVVVLTSEQNTYALNKIDIDTGEITCLTQSETPIIPICDAKTLEPLLIYKIKGRTADVSIVNNGRNKIIHNNADVTTVRYVSAVRRNNGEIVCRKLEKTPDGIEVSLFSSVKGLIRSTLIPNTEEKELSDLHTCIDNDGSLIAITFTKEDGKDVYLSCQEDKRPLLNTISKKFPTENWDIVQTTANGNIFLLRIQNFNEPTTWMTYNKRTGKYNTIASCDKMPIPSQQIKLVCISSNKKQAPMYITFTAGRKTSSNRALVVMIGKQYIERTWQPLVHLLANRGMDVICLPPRPGRTVNDVKEAIQWYYNAKPNNKGTKIVIHGNEEAALKAFAKVANASVFIGDLYEEQSYNKVSQLIKHLSQDKRHQLFLIGDINENSNERYQFQFVGDNATVSQLTDPTLKPIVSAAIIESYLQKTCGTQCEEISEAEQEQIEESSQNINKTIQGRVEEDRINYRNKKPQQQTYSSQNKIYQQNYDNEIYDAY